MTLRPPRRTPSFVNVCLSFVPCPLYPIKLMHPLHQNHCTAKRTWGGGGRHCNASCPPCNRHPHPHPHALRLLLHGLPAQHGHQVDDQCQRMQESVFLAPLSGTLAGTTQDLAAHSLVGSPGGLAPGRRVRSRGGGTGFEARPPPLSYQEEYARITTHRPGPALVQGVARQPPAPCGHDGRAVVTGPPPQACRRGPGWGEHLARPWCGAQGHALH
jgi:hypothetical protein